MAKQSGLAYAFYVDGYNISGDVGALSKVGAPTAMLDVTSIDKLAHERIRGQGAGQIDFNAFWNTDPGPPAREHIALKNNQVSPGTEMIGMLFCGLTVGSAVACIQAKQANYDWRRGQDGSLLGSISLVSDAFPLEWGEALTAGQQIDTGATNGVSIDGQNYGLVGVSSAFGLSAYLEVFAFTGTSITITLQDSADNITFANIAGVPAFTAVSAAPATQRIENLTATVRRYVRAVSSGVFTSATYALAVCRYLGARDP